MRYVDSFADWLQDSLGYRNQLRIAVVVLWLAVPACLVTPLVSKSWFEAGVWFMSAAALLYTAASVVAATEAAQEAQNNNGGTDER
jgi:hypothetical protein